MTIIFITGSAVNVSEAAQVATRRALVTVASGDVQLTSAIDDPAFAKFGCLHQRGGGSRGRLVRHGAGVL